MRCIADVNVFLPVLAEGHSHRPAAVTWWDACGDGEVGLCLPVHLALLRLLSNPRVMGRSLLAPEQAWNAVAQLADDPRVVSADKIPQGHAKHWRANVTGREPTPNLWTDAWLAALAQSLRCEMVTFDHGFRSFAKLTLRLLEVDPQ
ncbi:MAG: TA system VapC family ribonuclease toxin [Gammaproteobacteria bacterium]